MLTRANSTFDGPLAPLRRGFLYALLRRVTALSRAWCLRRSPYPLDSSFSKPIRVALALRRNCDDRLGKHFSTRTQGVPPKRTAVPGWVRAGHSTPGAAERAPQSGAKSFAIACRWEPRNGKPANQHCAEPLVSMSYFRRCGANAAMDFAQRGPPWGAGLGGSSGA